MNVSTPQAAADIRKQRLLREIAGNSEGFLPRAESTGKTLGMVLVSLAAAVAFSGDPPRGGEKVAALAVARTVASAPPASPAASQRGGMDSAAPAGNVEDKTY